MRKFWLILFCYSAMHCAVACVHFGPHSYLADEQGRMLEMPEASFQQEFYRLAGITLPENVRNDWDLEDRDLRDTTAVDTAELKEALGDRTDAAEIVTAYQALREALAPFNQHALDDLDERNDRPANPDSPLLPNVFDLSSYEALLGRVPSEFAHYLRGAAAFRNGDMAGAVASFEAVLALPAAERQFRSTWAAYMLGKARENEEPARAIGHYLQVRELAQTGFRDALDLTTDSLGWQARAAMVTGDMSTALHLYVAFGAHPGCAKTAYTSAREVCRSAFLTETFDLGLVSDALCRQLITSYLLSHKAPEMAARWLEVLGTPEPGTVLEGADRLAWLAYNQGDMAGAAQWLGHSDREAPYSRWVQAKLMLREGKLAEAAVLLEHTCEAIEKGGVEDLAVYEFPPGEYATRDDSFIGGGFNRAHAEHALAQVARGQYDAGLAAFVRGDARADAACLAERILTLEELEAFVQAHPDAGPPAVLRGEAEEDEGEQEPPGLWLRHLVARRLARSGAWERALPLYPEKLRWRDGGVREAAVNYYALLKKSGDTKWDKHQRAEALIGAAAILREDGMVLLGTELEPDGWIDWGYFPYWREFPPPFSEEPSLAGSLPATDFTQRFGQSKPALMKRYHYTYVAAEQLWTAARMLPDNDTLTAEALYTGGTYLMYSDPAAADAFYKALVNRNPNLLIARQADARRWFPETFTDVVLYQPYPRPWYGSRRHAALLAGATVLGVLLAAGLVAEGRRRGRQAVA